MRRACLFPVVWLSGSLAFASNDPKASPAYVAGENVIEVTVSDFEDGRGKVRVALFKAEKGFPSEVKHAVARQVSAIRKGAGDTTLVFRDVLPGTYAVSALHDTDDDGEMDTNWFGVPTEGYAASRDARGTLSPPSFDDAKFVHEGATTKLRVKLAY